ncbi:MAG TPA: DnaJ C-terminal domain-containing protein, partial [Pengzhenrongella sp.]
GGMFGGGSGSGRGRSSQQGGAGFEDILGGLFGGTGGGGGGGFRSPRPAVDLAATTTLPFRQAVEGSTVTLGVDGRSVTARIPAGVRDGQKIRLRGKGRPGEQGGPAGDLVVTVRVSPHPVFSLDGNSIRLNLPVTFDEASLGATVTVPTFDGDTVRLRVPEGTPSGRVLRMRGKGITTSKGTGDLLVTVQVVVPQKLSVAAREAVEAFAAATASEDPRADLAARAVE